MTHPSGAPVHAGERLISLKQAADAIVLRAQQDAGHNLSYRLGLTHALNSIQALASTAHPPHGEGQAEPDGREVA